MESVEEEEISSPLSLSLSLSRLTQSNIEVEQCGGDCQPTPIESCWWIILHLLLLRSFSVVDRLLFSFLFFSSLSFYFFSVDTLSDRHSSSLKRRRKKWLADRSLDCLSSSTSDDALEAMNNTETTRTRHRRWSWRSCFAVVKHKKHQRRSQWVTQRTAEAPSPPTDQFPSLRTFPASL